MTRDPDLRPEPGSDAAAIKACCAAGYSSDLVSLLLGDSYHPGGLTLTRRLLHRLGLQPGDRMLDVASGIGTTSLLAATEYGARVDGIDLSDANVALAHGAAAARGLADRVTFKVGDAEALPLLDAGWDVVVCECALCTFPDKPTAAKEMSRALRPGGRLGIADITADRNRMPAELTSLTAWVACIADARPGAEYESLLEDAGLRVVYVEHHPSALDRMIRQIEARLGLLAITARPQLEAVGVDLARTRPLVEAARAAVLDGTLGYVVIVAQKPAA